MTYISGEVMPLVALAQSRYVLTAMRMDSVPPEVATEVSLASEQLQVQGAHLCLRLVGN